MPGTGFVSDAQIVFLVNEEWPELYREIVELGPPDVYSSTQAFTTVAGTVAYALPATFYQATCVYEVQADGRRLPVQAINDFARGRYLPPQSVLSLEMEYVPVPATISPIDPLSTTVDGIAGFELLLTARMARRILQKRKADTSSVDAEIAQLTAHLRNSGRRSRGPRYMTDVDDADLRWPVTTQIAGYRIRGANIEFYQPSVAVWP